MDSTTTFLILIGIMVANQLVLRVAGLRASKSAFWTLQFVNLGLICFIFTVGLPGFRAYPIISYAIGLLFTLRVIQNNVLRTRYLQKDARRARDARSREVSELVERMQGREEEESSEEA